MAAGATAPAAEHLLSVTPISPLRKRGVEASESRRAEVRKSAGEVGPTLKSQRSGEVPGRPPGFSCRHLGCHCNSTEFCAARSARWRTNVLRPSALDAVLSAFRRTEFAHTFKCQVTQYSGEQDGEGFVWVFFAVEGVAVECLGADFIHLAASQQE